MLSVICKVHNLQRIKCCGEEVKDLNHSLKTVARLLIARLGKNSCNLLVNSNNQLLTTSSSNRFMDNRAESRLIITNARTRIAHITTCQASNKCHNLHNPYTCSRISLKLFRPSKTKILVVIKIAQIMKIKVVLLRIRTSTSVATI